VIRPALFTVAAAVVVAVSVLALRPDYSAVRRGAEDEGYLKSDTCLSCHPDHTASWRKTFHRTMTQDATPQSVVGDFTTENRLDYLGVSATMERRGDRFQMTLAHSDGRAEVVPVVRTVGSRRIQQYLTRVEDRYVRLPIAYHIEERRWISLNGSFFYPDGSNYLQHQAVWDLNCVFCHNVKAQPHFDWTSRKVDTEVAELGIACGACHGRTATHVQAALSPVTRTAWRLFPSRSRHVVNPEELPSERSMMVCGHCHGQRVPNPEEKIRSILSEGDPFDAGEDLTSHYRPVGRETRIGSYSFESRFWADGSPRLTAYEYQGLVRSACFRKGEPGHRLTCLTCHDMHAGEPKGMIRAENKGDGPCLSCHPALAPAAALTTHTGHEATSPGSRCYACHMPRVVYGVMSIHRTHEITVPDPGLTVRPGVPNACNQCHVDRSVGWSARAAARIWPRRFPSATVDPRFEVAEGPRSLFSGDAVQRSLAAEAMGAPHVDRAWARPFLLEAFDDPYPIVRFFAARALRSSGWGGPALDYLGSHEERERSLLLGRGLASPSADLLELVERFRKERVDVDIEVGE